VNTTILFILALLPIIWLIISLGILKWPGYKACPIALNITFLLSIFVWKMSLVNSITAALEGVALAIWPITLVIISAVFTYNLSLHTGGMEIIKKMITSVTTDKRILVLILAWGFGGFLEAIAGFGTAVAIPAGIMYALGFNPLFAAIICLISNTTPTAFGAIGIPVVTLARVTGLDVAQLSYAVALQLAPLVVFLPIALVMVTGRSIKAIKGVFLITLISGISFAIPQLLIAKYLGPELPAVVGSVCSMTCTILAAKVLSDKSENSKLYQVQSSESTTNSKEKITMKQGFMAWLPFILVFVFILGSSTLIPSINSALSKIQTSIQIYTGEGASPYVFKWLATPGTLIIIATYISGLIYGMKFSEISKILFKTINQLSKSTITIVSIIALAKIMGYSGMINSIATVLVMITGTYYPLIAPMIGALGTFVTGSDTSANVLFGNLQAEAARAAGANPYWIAAINTGGATAGKMISPQSIAIAVAATGLQGSEGKILNSVIKFCAVYVIILGLISYFCAPIFGF
jgi:lactate permease